MVAIFVFQDKGAMASIGAGDFLRGSSSGEPIDIGRGPPSWRTGRQKRPLEGSSPITTQKSEKIGTGHSETERWWFSSKGDSSKGAAGDVVEWVIVARTRDSKCARI
jgi:hypothetical protein